MAGNYPDAPSYRMALDKDGTVFLFVSTTVATTQLSGANVTSLNDEGEGGYVTPAIPFSGGPFAYIGCVFPEARDFDGVYFNIDANGSGYDTSIKKQLQVSTNTTNLVDGTWTSVGSLDTNAFSTVLPGYRTGIVSTTQLAIRGVRFALQSQSPYGSGFMVKAFHIYGEPSPGENPNRLELWHPTLDQKIAPAAFDWGNVPRSSSADRTFRVKNLSAALTAIAPRVAFDVLTDTSPSIPAQHTLSVGGGSFLAQVTLSDLAPGAISPVVTIRRITPSNATFGLWAARVFAESTVWT